jgi:DNA-directed RNA polymerase specialized sigma24 family protein
MSAKRDVLLRAHRRHLRHEDLEDCLSQATLELIVQVRRGRVFAGRAHVAHALEQRFVSRIRDRRRAVSGRSPIQAALEGAFPLGPGEGNVALRDHRFDPERSAIVREELRSVVTSAGALSQDQRLVIATQSGLQMGCQQFCGRFAWSPEKYRKVAQRARLKLRRATSVEPVPSGVSASD